MFYLLQSAMNTDIPVSPDRPHTETGQTHIKLHLSMLSSILTHGNTTKDGLSLLVMHELTQNRLLDGRGRTLSTVRVYHHVWKMSAWYSLTPGMS